MLNFIWPWAFWLLPLPLLAHLLLPKSAKRDAALFVPFYRDVLSFEPGAGRPGRRKIGRWLLLLLIWTLLVTATAGPQWHGEPLPLPTVGRDLMLAVDISGSMAEEDMVLGGDRVTRLALVKKVVNDFIERRVGDRVGLLLFGSEPYIQAPLTFDRRTVGTLLDEAEIGFAGKKTSIGDAIGLAVKRLRDRPADKRVLILLTDGSNTAGAVEPLTAADLAAKTGVRIHTIGVGADEMVVRGFFGSQRINPSADLDEETLTKIAEKTGGGYFRARNPDELEKIYRLIDELEPIDQESEIFRPVKFLFHLPLAGALILTFLWGTMMVLISTLNNRGRA
ncbi:MAG: VWA domain-containing protein [Desulfurivibrionaceae bacterium]|nr:VWA domain-containing protein [Desulfurivibrionaceae bacterium]